MRLHLIRHTTPAVEVGVCYGQADVPLASTFPAEAEAIKLQLQERLQGKPPYLVFSSPLSRCLRLAEACGYPRPELDERLLELSFGAWELQRYDAIDDPQLQRWYDDYLYTAPTGGESFVTQVARVSAFLEELRRRTTKTDPSAGEALVFTHGGVLLAAGIWAGWYPLEEAFEHRQPYGAILTLEL